MTNPNQQQRNNEHEELAISCTYFGTLSTIGLISSQGFAGVCHNGIDFSVLGFNSQLFPLAGNNLSLSLQCGSGSPDSINLRGYGTAIHGASGIKGVQANKSGGVGSITVEGLNQGGAVVCDVTDGAANGSPSAIVFCPDSGTDNAVRFRVRGNF